MKYYLEINILKNLEIDKHFILSRLFYQIHLGLVSMKDNDEKVNLGIAFPEYNFNPKKVQENSVGKKIRLFANTAEELEKFNAKQQFANLQDYIHITAIRDVPDNVSKYAIFQRYQPKTSYEKLTRRYKKREEELQSIINNSKDQSKIDDAKRKLKARQEKRNNQSLEEFIASSQYDKKISLERQFLPHINVKSNDKNSKDIAKNNINHFKLWVKKIDRNQPMQGKFNTYGFSQNQHGKGQSDDDGCISQLATVPVF